MTSEQKRTFIYGPWLALPVVLISYLIFWNNLPERMAVHSSVLTWQTDNWMSREATLLLSLAGLLAVLVVSTWRVSHRAHVSKILLIRHCAAVAVITGVLMFVLLRNL
jgi:hypothetical protein